MRVTRISVSDKTLPLGLSEDLTQLDPLIEKFKDYRGSMIPVLQGTQNLFGYIPQEAFPYLAEKLNLNLSEMYGVATFYAQFRLNPVGKHIIKVCHGTACHVQNASAITESLAEALKVNDGETTEDGVFTLESVACLGCCSLAPVMMIGEETYGKLTGRDAVKVIKDIRLKENS